MSVNVYGFGVITEFDNRVQPGHEVVGDISDRLKTYSRNIETFTDPNDASGRFELFSIKNDSDVVLDPTSNITDACLRVIKIISSFDDSDTVENQWSAHADSGTLGSTTFGSQIVTSGKHIPSSVETTIQDLGETVNIVIWFSPSAMTNEYPEFEIQVVPPLMSVPALADTHANVLNAVNAFGLKQRQDAVSGLIGQGIPPTEIDIISLTWTNPNDVNQTLNTEWSVLVWGPQGKNTQNVIRAIREHLVANSSLTEEQWIGYFPDIVSINTYTFLPRWEDPAVDIAGAGSSLYSPTEPVKGIMAKLTKMLNSRVANDLEDFSEVTNIFHKSISLLVVGSRDNTDGQQLFGERFPDYAILALNDSQINRLRQDTRNMAAALEATVRQAESDTGVNTLPTEMKREAEDGLRFIVYEIGTTVLRVASRETYLGKLNA